VSAFHVERVQHPHLVDGIDSVRESLGQTDRFHLAPLPCRIMLSLLIVLATGKIGSGEFQTVAFSGVFTTTVSSHVRSASLAPHLDSVCILSRHSFPKDVILDVCKRERRCLFVDFVDKSHRRTRNAGELLQELSANELATLPDPIDRVSLSRRKHLGRWNGGRVDALDTSSQVMGVDVSRLLKKDTIPYFKLASENSR
jgi:hypothetical protein